MPPAPETEFEPPRFRAIVAVVLGSTTMVASSLQSLLLGELADAGQFPASLIQPAGIAAVLAMGLSLAVCGLFLPPRHLRTKAAGAALVLLLTALAGIWVRGEALIPLRVLAGLAGGVTLWITVGLIARLARPEPWAAAFFMIQAAGQVFAAGLFASLILPSLGAAAGPVVLAVLAGIGLAASLALPSALPDLADQAGRRGPSRLGLAGLMALFLYFAGSGAAWFHMRPIAADLGLSSWVGLVGLAVLVAQMLGALLSLALAERIPRRGLMVAVCLATIGAYGLLALGPPSLVFLSAYALAGLAGLVLGASLFSVLQAFDPSRRAGAISATAQLLAAGLGPLAGMALAGPLAGMALAGPLGPRGALLAAILLILASQAVVWRFCPPDRQDRTPVSS
jgi:MFS family permease